MKIDEVTEEDILKLFETLFAWDPDETQRTILPMNVEVMEEELIERNANYKVIPGKGGRPTMIRIYKDEQ